jgi:hypothetical protein
MATDTRFDTEALRALGINVVEPDMFLCKAIDEEPELFHRPVYPPT